MSPNHTLNLNTIGRAVLEIQKRGEHVRTCGGSTPGLLDTLQLQFIFSKAIRSKCIAEVVTGDVHVMHMFLRKMYDFIHFALQL